MQSLKTATVFVVLNIIGIIRIIIIRIIFLKKKCCANPLWLGHVLLFLHRKEFGTGGLMIFATRCGALSWDECAMKSLLGRMITPPHDIKYLPNGPKYV